MPKEKGKVFLLYRKEGETKVFLYDRFLKDELTELFEDGWRIKSDKKTF